MIFVTIEVNKKCGVTHKGWENKDDLKLLKYDDFKLDFWFLPWFSILMDHEMIKHRTKPVLES